MSLLPPKKDALRKTKQTMQAFRGKQSMFPEVEELHLQHVTDTRSNGYAVSTEMLRLKVLEFLIRSFQCKCSKSAMGEYGSSQREKARRSAV